ncbi:MAG: DUF3866 family protein [Coriobacteriales bacterium]|nr:DUF3866 family protein [Coriobacteriales bacterium]
MYKTATVIKELGSYDDAQLLLVSCDNEATNAPIKAINYLAIGSRVKPDAKVIINTLALELGLGTGGYAFVQPTVVHQETSSLAPQLQQSFLTCEASESLPLSPQSLQSPLVHEAPESPQSLQTPKLIQSPQSPLKLKSTQGHIVKLRYTPLQHNVLAVEEPASPYHSLLANAKDINGMPVVCCALHSQLPLVAAAIKSVMPDARIAYCMTDEAALMLAFSNLVRQCKQSGLIDTTISCGQATGGDLEAVSLYSGLLAARFVAKADASIVAIGPGNVGTSTAFGNTGIAQGVALNAVSSLGGVPVCALRVSFADKRERHFGVSHHSIVALANVCLTKCKVALPASLPGSQRKAILQALEQNEIYGRHDVTDVWFNRDDICLRGVEVTSMGRNEIDDPSFFLTSLAAGVFCAELLSSK